MKPLELSVNRIHRNNVFLKLTQRLRRWPNLKTTLFESRNIEGLYSLFECIVFAGRVCSALSVRAQPIHLYCPGFLRHVCACVRVCRQQAIKYRTYTSLQTLSKCWFIVCIQTTLSSDLHLCKKDAGLMLAEIGSKLNLHGEGSQYPLITN